MKKILLIVALTILPSFLDAFHLPSFFSRLWQSNKSKSLTKQQLYDLHTGNYYFWLTKFDKAEQYYRKLDESGYPHAQRLLSTTYWGQGNYRQAIECLINQVKIAPTAEAYKDLGSMYLHFGDEENAVDYLTKAAALNYVPALRDLTIYYFNKKLFALAEAYGKQAADLGNIEVCAILSTFFWHRKEYTKAEYFFSAATAHDAMPYIHLAYIYNDIYNNQEKALDLLKEGLEKKNILCALELGNYYFSKKEYVSATYYYRQLIDCPIDDPVIQYMMRKPHFTLSLTELLQYKNVAGIMLGHVYEEQGLDDLALKCFLVCAQHGDPQGQYGAGTLYLRHGNTQPGLEYLRLSADQNYDIASYTLGKYYFEQRDLAQAKIYMEKCITSTHDGIIRNVHFILGHIYMQERNTQQALIHFKAAADTGDHNSCYEYASLMESEGDIDEAKRYYSKAADLGHPHALAKTRALEYYPAT